MMTSQDLVKTTKDYYDSKDADEFYYRVWGGEDIHIGLYEWPDEDIFIASMRTIQKISSLLLFLDEKTKILDIGSGYGGAARYLASQFRCHVTCLNLSETENARNEFKNKEVRLEDHIKVLAGNFEHMPFDDGAFDVVWSQDAILHSGHKQKVFKEAHRVLRKHGHFIFTDPMQSDDCSPGVLQPILKRIHLMELGSVQKYKQMAKDTGFSVINILEMPNQLIHHYTKVLTELKNRKAEMLKVCSASYLENMQNGLQHWIDGGKKGFLNWGIIHLQKS